MIDRKIKTHKQTTGGFMALMSAIIISVILLVIATNLSSTSFYGRSNILDTELKEKSFALAEACADTAILKLITDPNYSPVNESVVVSENSCIVESITEEGGLKIVKVQADYRNYITNLEIEVDSDMSITRFEEK